MILTYGRRHIFVELLLGLWTTLLGGALQAQPLAFVPVINPFPVLDDNGAPDGFPFLGGLNFPRPQFVDIDADGDLDLFLQEHPDAVLFFENEGTPGAARFAWRSARYEGLAIGGWYRFADLDADGDVDLLAETPLSYIRYYRNEGTPEQPDFALAADTLRDTEGQPIVADRQNIPALAGLHCTGLPDLFLGTLAGRLVYYAHAGLDSLGVPRFRFVSGVYQNIEIIGAFGKQDRLSAPQHGANAITFVDLDADDDLDLLWGDFFSPSLYLLRNTGTCEQPRLERTSDVFPLNGPVASSGYNVPAFGDLDADGDPDLFVGVLGGAFSSTQNTANNFLYFENDGGQFLLRTSRFLSMIDIGEESMPAIADLDADGDPDVVLANKIDPSDPRSARLSLFENQGTVNDPLLRLTASSLLDEAVGFSQAPEFADVDADGDLDLFVGTWTGTVAFYRNDGTPAAPNFTAVDPAYVRIAGSNATPVFVDLDADGDLDLFAGEAFGTLNFFRNTGTAAAARFELETEAYGDLQPGTRSAPAFWDADRDGDADLFIGTRENGVAFYRNTGTPQEAVFTREEAFLRAFPAFAAPAFADFDGDGDADLLVGGEGGGLTYFENRASTTATAVFVPETPGLSEEDVYPNPFKQVTTFRFRLGRAANVQVELYDVLGRRTAIVTSRAYSAGTHRVSFDAEGLPAGPYLYCYAVEGLFVLAGTMLLLK